MRLPIFIRKEHLPDPTGLSRGSTSRVRQQDTSGGSRGASFFSAGSYQLTRRWQVWKYCLDALAWIFHKPERCTFCSVFRPWARGLKGFLCSASCFWEALHQGQKGSTPANRRTSPVQERGDQQDLPPSSASAAWQRDAGGPGRRCERHGVSRG